MNPWQGDDEDSVKDWRFGSGLLMMSVEAADDDDHHDEEQDDA